MDYRATSMMKSLALCLCVIVSCCYAGSAVDPKAPESAGVPVPARYAFNEMYKLAHQWAKDVMPLQMTSGEAPGISNEGGKAAVWTALFVSPSRREVRTFHYAVVAASPEIGRGVTIGRVQPWGGPTPKSNPFRLAEFSVDSDAAWATAAKQAGAWLKKNPAKKLSMYLVSESRFAGPTWYFMWGDRKSGYLAFVNAMTGQLVKGT